MEPLFYKVFFVAAILYGISATAYGCVQINFKDDSPIITQDPDCPNGTYTLTYQFDHGNDGGSYTCFLRDSERPEACPPIVQEEDCEPCQNVTFRCLDPGVWFTCGVRCRLGGVLRTISRTIGTPVTPQNCVPRLINDGISFPNVTDFEAGISTVCIMWASTGTPTGFWCTVDDGEPFQCSSPLYLQLQTGQYLIKVEPHGCPGGRTLRRRFEVPRPGCALPFSFT